MVVKTLKGCTRFAGLIALVSALNSCAFILGPSLQETRHIVRKGDTLEKIATRYYGCSNRTKVLIDANPCLMDVEALRPGLRLDVPVAYHGMTN